MAKIAAKQKKLLDAYYANAISVAMLRDEQASLARDMRQAEELMESIKATMEEWKEILGIAMRLATRCGQGYRVASDRGK